MPTHAYRKRGLVAALVGFAVALAALPASAARKSAAEMRATS